MFVLRSTYQRALDEADTQDWYLKKRIKELETALAAERILRDQLENKIQLLMEDNRQLLERRYE